jgi:hypothetical protein
VRPAEVAGALGPAREADCGAERLGEEPEEVALAWRQREAGGSVDALVLVCADHLRSEETNSDRL